MNHDRIYYVIHTIAGVGYGYSIPANERNMKLVNEYFNLQKQVKELEKALHEQGFICKANHELQ